MAEEQNNVVGEETLTGLDKLQRTYEQNANTINIAVIALLVVIVGALAYFKFYKPKRELAAQNEIFEAQYYFEKDSFQKVLDLGIESVASSYSRTDAGNLAKYYAGVSHYQLNNFTAAEEYLKKFCPCGDDVVGGLAISTLADAQYSNGKVDAALKNYKKSAEMSDNIAIAPVLLFKAAMAYEVNGKFKEAMKYYEEIKNDFPDSDQANDIDKYIGRVAANL